MKTMLGRAGDTLGSTFWLRVTENKATANTDAAKNTIARFIHFSSVAVTFLFVLWDCKIDFLIRIVYHGCHKDTNSALVSVRVEGIGPSTPVLSGLCSTTELHTHNAG